MAKATLFKNNKSQAVRIPKALELPSHVVEVEITRLGQARLIAPANARWASFFDGPVVTGDFLAPRDPSGDRRDQGEDQVRDFAS